MTTPPNPLTYAQAHARLTAARGRAAEHACQHCGSAAVCWAYDHSDPSPLFEAKPFRSPLAYSLDHDRYRPLCGPCHRAFDAPFETQEHRERRAEAARHRGIESRMRAEARRAGRAR